MAGEFVISGQTGDVPGLWAGAESGHRPIDAPFLIEEVQGYGLYAQDGDKCALDFLDESFQVQDCGQGFREFR